MQSRFARRVWVAWGLVLLVLVGSLVGARGGARAQSAASAPSASAPPPSASAAPAPKHEGRESVYVGIYVNQIYEFSLKDNNLVVDFWLWFRWKSDDLKPYQSFELKNARIDNKGEPSIKKIGDMNYAYLRVVANLTHFWDVSAYPLDHHIVPIEIEDANSEEDQLLYLADVESSGMDDGVAVVSFLPHGGKAYVKSVTYHTNYGDTSLPSTDESRYSRFVYPMEFHREGTRYFLKLFFGLFIAAAISFLAFFMKPTDLDPRFGLGVGAIFAAIASQYVVAGALPDSATISLADKLHIIAFGAIFVSIAESTWSLHMLTNGQEERSKLLDRRSALLVPLAYVALSTLAVLTR